MVMERRRQFRTNFGRVRGGFPESSSGLIMGDFAKSSVPSTTLASQGALCNAPLPFSRKYLLSTIDNGRILQFRAGSGLRSQSMLTCNLGQFPNDSSASLDPRSQITDQG